MSHGYTKEQLRNELISHGFPAPPANAKKTEFIELYDKHVRPLLPTNDFSSDDEEPAVGPTSESKGDSDMDKSLTSAVSYGLDQESVSTEGKFENEVKVFIRNLTDQQLRDELVNVGCTNNGPIVATTRRLYEGILLPFLLSASSPTSSGNISSNKNGDANIDAKYANGFSDSDSEVASETASRASCSSRGSTTPKRKTMTPKKTSVIHSLDERGMNLKESPISTSKTRSQARARTQVENGSSNFEPKSSNAFAGGRSSTSLVSLRRDQDRVFFGRERDQQRPMGSLPRKHIFESNSSLLRPTPEDSFDKETENAVTQSFVSWKALGVGALVAAGFAVIVMVIVISSPREKKDELDELLKIMEGN